VVQTVVFFAALVIVVINLLVDLTYAWIDPRIRVAR
jgi:peptide/nickel transport system permease protein